MLRETLLEKTDFLFPSYQCIKYQCHVTSCFSVGIVSIFPSPPLGMPSLNQYKCYVCCYSLLEFINVLFLLCLRDMFPSWNHLLPLALKIFLFYYIDPWALRYGGGYVDEGILFRAECAKVSHSMHIFQLWVSFLITIKCKKKLLWWVIFWSMGIQVCH